MQQRGLQLFKEQQTVNAMKWQSGRRSQNVEDRRGARVSRGVVGGGIGAVVIALVAMLFGVDPGAILPNDPYAGGAPSYEQPGPASPEEEQLKEFVSVVLATTEDTWSGIFSEELNRAYEEPTLVLFSGAVESACGFAQAAVGPFYCPGDHKVYIDLSFYEQLRSRFRAPGDFAQAYVIAHEVGHHVQTLLGISQQVDAARRRSGEAEANALSVQLELQADCLAGVWAYRTDQSQQVLQEGDVEEALNAASAIGDDRLQRQAQGYVVPESFTHGSSAQRVRWFRRGFQSGDLQQCDTFEAAQL